MQKRSHTTATQMWPQLLQSPESSSATLQCGCGMHRAPSLSTVAFPIASVCLSRASFSLPRCSPHSAEQPWALCATLLLPSHPGLLSIWLWGSPQHRFRQGLFSGREAVVAALSDASACCLRRCFMLGTFPPCWGCRFLRGAWRRKMLSLISIQLPYFPPNKN